jgi:hypothetical protein
MKRYLVIRRSVHGGKYYEKQFFGTIVTTRASSKPEAPTNNNTKNISIFGTNLLSMPNMMNYTGLSGVAKVWVKRRSGKGEIIQVMPDPQYTGAGLSYDLYAAFESTSENLGRILFDQQGYWIYDGDTLSIAEQEQVAKFIMGYVEGS